MLSYCCLLALALGSGAIGQEKPVSLVINGGFERSGGWSKPANATLVDSGRTGRCLRMVGGGASQEVLADGKARTFSCSVEIKTEDVAPAPTGGYAYAAVYQLDAAGKWIAFKDFAQLKGTNDWKRYDFTFELVPRAETISLRCGIYNATGTAWFDNWTLVEGRRAYGFAEVSTIGPGAGPPGGAVAVFREEGFPAKGAASSPDRLGKLLRDAGLKVTYLSAEDLANPRKLLPGLFNIVVLPYGESFPAEARRTMTRFLHHGGGFISTGGYAFNNLLLGDGENWIDEDVALARRLTAALDESVLPDGGFETTENAPIKGMQLDGKWRRDGDICAIVEENAKEGRRCAKVTVTAQDPREDRWYLDIEPQRGARYRVSGWIKTEDVTPIGHGMAYMALYEYGDEDKLGEWRDFAVVRGTHDWEQFHYDFSPPATTTRVQIKLGLYRATGTAWFDDIRLANIAGTDPRPMNTSTGTPKDGLTLAPSQIGVFDASFPLRRATGARAGEEQHILPARATIEGELSGWAASGVQGYDNARWIELLDSRDRFGRKRGAAGALMINYGGFYSGSMWGFFGVENRDLFDGSVPELDEGFVNLAGFMVRGLFLRNLKTDLASYRDGEAVGCSVTVENFGSEEQRARVSLQALPEGDEKRAVNIGSAEVTLPPGESQVIEAVWKPGEFDADLYRLVARLSLDGQVIDEMRSGFVVQRDEVVKSGRELRFHDNYFHLDGRPVFLYGSDTYSYAYNSSFENPWTWHLDHVAARDYGFNVYENLQYSRAPAYEFTDSDWRKFEGMAQSCQREGLVFMPCQLVGHNVAISEDLIEKQAAQCKAYGQHMVKYPGLLYYLNGDFRLKHDDKEALGELWNQWLAEKYKTAEALKASWGEEVHVEWGKLVYPPPRAANWDSARECDKARFEIWLTKRWVERHVAAVRSEDKDHPITSEYYRTPSGGLDLILTIDGQDASNIGYFDEPYLDIDRLPLSLRMIDLRMRGKSLGLGEYGVKTHPAWTVENGARGYHIVRTEEEQKRLFMAVAHYGLGMGACKVQNWCLRDASHWVFPWGVFYPNGRIPKDVACWHRNLSLVTRHFRPKYVPPNTAVLLPDNMRLGAHPQTGIEIAFNAFRALMGLHANFNVINEHHIEALTNETKFLIWPSPFCPDDACYQKVLQWVKEGGRLLVTGDISFDWDRKRTRTERLKELCGVEFVKEIYGPPVRTSEGAEQVWQAEAMPPVLLAKPCVEVKPVEAEVLASTSDGLPALLLNRPGSGKVIYCTDPLEMGSAEDVVASLQNVYGPALAGIAPGVVMPGTGRGIHLCRQGLQGGGEFVMAFNTNMPPGSKEVTLPAGDADVVATVAARYPAMTATNGENILVAVGCSGEATFDGQPLVGGDAQVIYLSLDGKALPISEAILLCPFSTGRTAFGTRHAPSDLVTLLGDIRQGEWRTFERREGKPELTLDEDTMTCLVLICKRGEEEKWAQVVSEAMRHPERIGGY